MTARERQRLLRSWGAPVADPHADSDSAHERYRSSLIGAPVSPIAKASAAAKAKASRPQCDAGRRSLDGRTVTRCKLEAHSDKVDHYFGTGIS